MGKLSISQFAGMNIHYRMYSFDYFLDSMVRFDIQNVELYGGSPHLYSETATLNQVQSIRQAIETSDLKLVCYTPEQITYPFNIAAADNNLRKMSLNYFMRNIEITAELGTTLMLVNSGWGDYGKPMEEAWNYSREALGVLAEKAGELGVTLLLEPLQPFETNLITNLDLLKRMLTEVDSSHMTGMIDTVAMAVAGDTITDYFKTFGRIEHIHFIDGSPSGHQAWGLGTLPLESYLSELKENGYSYYLTVELADPAYLPDPDSAFLQAMNAIKAKL
ncbi:sugar phosphate isomerase/epimerase family protein [Neobacillus muris]|uniref:sugar phosphate isomerase/epimerase family protein n=1 Tax=Neobacillus muris TaxID=2941334 RepID=UPI00203F607A|nr:TIM barrel protein [Neobacillus muris]